MKSTFRLFVSSLLVGLMASGGVPILRASNGDILTYTGSGTLNSVEVFRISSTGSVVTTNGFTQTDTAGTSKTTISEGDLSLRTSSSTIQYGDGTVVSATATATRSQGAFLTGYLLNSATFGNALEGSVLCATTSVAGQGVTFVVCPAALNLTSWAGIAYIATSSGSAINVYDSGWVNALTTGTVNPGDQLVTSSASAGYLQAAGTVASTNTVAVALSAGNAAGGLTKVRMR